MPTCLIYLIVLVPACHDPVEVPEWRLQAPAPPGHPAVRPPAVEEGPAIPAAAAAAAGPPAVCEVSVAKTVPVGGVGSVVGLETERLFWNMTLIFFSLNGTAHLNTEHTTLNGSVTVLALYFLHICPRTVELPFIVVRYVLLRIENVYFSELWLRQNGAVCRDRK